jgi:hypothetical protein
LKYDSLNKEESLRQKEKKENLELISIFKQLKNNSKNINQNKSLNHLNKNWKFPYKLELKNNN